MSKRIQYYLDGTDIISQTDGINNLDCKEIKEKMSEINVATKVHLLSCNGGTEINNKSVAGTLAELTIGTPVNSVVNGSVYYKSWYNNVFWGYCI